MDVWDAGWKRRSAAAFGGLAVLALLLAPLSLPPEGSVGRAFGGSAHVALFAGLAWLVGRALSPSRRGWLPWAGLAFLSAGVEWLQPLVGRSAEWVDWFYGIGGAACICGTWRWRGGLRWAGVLALGLFPWAWEGAMIRLETQAFPVLAQPGRLWSSRGWSLNGVNLSVSHQEGFRLSPGPSENSTSYPGFFREPTCSDWRRIRALHLDLFWPETLPAVFAVRVDDRPGNPPYAERFQREFSVTNGWNRVQIPSEEIAWTAGGRPMRMDHVTQWGVFLVSGVSFDYFSVGTVRLDLPKEQP